MTPRPAATLVVVRPGKAGLEVLMIERSARGYFGGLWVFPGGAVEDIDDSELAHRAVTVPPACDDFAWRAAALRETVEEVGLALTDPPSAEALTVHGSDVFQQVVSRRSLLDGGSLRLLSRWVTPASAPTRFDARFYLTVLEHDPPLVPQPGEVVDLTWITPERALRRAEEGEWAIVTPTRHHLEWLAAQPDATAAWTAADRPIPLSADFESDGLVLVGLPPSVVP